MIVRVSSAGCHLFISTKKNGKACLSYTCNLKLIFVIIGMNSAMKILCLKINQTIYVSDFAVLKSLDKTTLWVHESFRMNIAFYVIATLFFSGRSNLILLIRMANFIANIKVLNQNCESFTS